jgi:predicted N-acetyltransferase YhbS
MIHSIRESTAADGAHVNAVALAAFGEYAGDYDDWPAFSAGIGRMADLAADGDLLVAECAGAVVGAIVHIGPGRPRNAAIYPADWSVLRMLVVDPAQRGQGVGRGLVHAGAGACVACGRAGGGFAYESDHGLGVATVPGHRVRACARAGADTRGAVCVVRAGCG